MAKNRRESFKKWLNQNRPELIVKLLGHAVYLGLALSLAYIFWSQNTGNQNAEKVPFIRYLGAGITMWASFHGTQYFAESQGHIVRRWFRGLNPVILGTCVMISLYVIVNGSSIIIHTVLIHAVLLLYVVWDIVGLTYYKKHSRLWYMEYCKLRKLDVIAFFGYGFFAYLPYLQLYLQGRYPNLGFMTDITPSAMENVSDFTTFLVIFIEVCLFASMAFSMKYMRDDNGVLGITEGYIRWSSTYDLGNAITEMERPVGQSFIQTKSLAGLAIVDYGCGAGHYSKILLEKGASVVYAIDTCLQMTAKLSDLKERDPKLNVINGGIGNLQEIQDGSIDGILCCLVIDHLLEHECHSLIVAAQRILKPGGWIYITDVNPYYELLLHPYARFYDAQGIETRIRVHPHSISSILKIMKDANFKEIESREKAVPKEFLDKLGDDYVPDEYPMIVEYFATK